MKDDELILSLDVAANVFEQVKTEEYREGMFNAGHAKLLRNSKARIQALTAEVERLKKSGAAILAEKHRERAEAKLWFGEFQHLRAEAERKDAALQALAEGNLGDLPWQVNYEKVKEVARAALQPQEKMG